MNKVVIDYTHGEIIEWLEKKFESERTYRDLEESPEFQTDVIKAKKKQEFFSYSQLPIDLLLVTKRQELIDEKSVIRVIRKRKKLFNYYTLHFVISSRKCFQKYKAWKYLKRRLLFYQFYLSRITEPKRVEIVVVIPPFDIPKNKLKFFRENGFGLLIVDKVAKREENVYPPKSLRERMTGEFQTSTENKEDLGETIQKIYKRNKIETFDAFKEAFKEKDVVEGFAIFFDQYILDAVDAVAGVTPEEFGERYIDRRLLTLMDKLTKVSYRERLKELVNEQLDENDNDYVFVSEVFQKLWKEFVGIPYSKFLKIFEPALLHVFPAAGEKQEPIYRDHYIHQFQVFLLGLYIIDVLYEDFTDCNCQKPEICWLIVASFHDMAYPVQLYDDWCTKFFHDVFRVDVALANLDLKTTFVDGSFLSCMGHIIYSLCCRHEKKPDSNWLIDKKELVQFFYKEITEEKKHCILSSLALLKMVQMFSSGEKRQLIKIMSGGNGTLDNIVQEVFVPSALAIALHDEKLWKKLRKGKSKDYSLKILDGMEFIKNPLTFLLIFCDTIQEWGRPFMSQKGKKDEKQKESRFHMRVIEANPEEGIHITIFTPKFKKKERFFRDKLKELNSIKTFLRQPSGRKFTIRLEDKNNKGEDFEMRGSSPSYNVKT